MSDAWDILHPAAERLLSAGFPSPLTDARILLAHVLQINPGHVSLVHRVSDADQERFGQLVDQRLAGQPVQYLVGEAPFRYEMIAVGPGVFIPRPETELLVDAVAAALRDVEVATGADQTAPDVTRQNVTGPDVTHPHVTGPHLTAPRRVVELCAGSGAISRSLATELPGLQQWAVEISPDAWPWLVKNLSGTSVQPVLADMAGCLPELDGSVHAVVVNPPYVPTTASLPRDVVDPPLALFGGEDGLDLIPAVAQTAWRLLQPGGVVACEHDESHPDAARQIFSQQGFVDVTTHLDLAGRARYVTAYRPS